LERLTNAFGISFFLKNAKPCERALPNGYREVVLFRCMAAERTFSKEVAEAFVPIEKLLLTYVETGAMNKQYREREAVVIHDPEDERLW